MPRGGQLTIETDTANVTIDGDLDDDGTPDITVDAQGNSRVFFVRSGAEATLQALVITGGGDGDSDGAIGAGILNFGTLTVEDSTISGSNTASVGGGIANQLDGTLTVTNSTISGNSGDAGGGILNINDGTMTVANSTISGNSARVGGGITNGNTMTVTNSTISGNSADFGGGIRNGGTLEIKSSIVAGNTADTGADCSNESGTITSLGFNLDSDGTCGFTESSDHQNVAVADVLVTDEVTGAPVLADNGGPTETIALVDLDTNPDNPAVDAIPTMPVNDCTFPDGVPGPGDVNVPVLFDQRGVERPQPADGDCDIGAFELIQAAPVSIADVIELFDQAVDDEQLTGAGPGGSGPGRLNALRKLALPAVGQW